MYKFVVTLYFYCRVITYLFTNVLFHASITFRLLELQSSGRKNVLRVIYRTKLEPHEHISSILSSSLEKNHRYSHSFEDIIYPSLHSPSSFVPTSSSSSSFFTPVSSPPNSSSSFSATILAVNVVENIPLVLADNKWHKLAVVISGNQLQVFLDCK